jgi:hypothetical protein
MVHTVAALQADSPPTLLVREHPAAVDHLLVDPAVTMEGLFDLRWLHRVYRGIFTLAGRRWHSGCSIES